jgi:hypothetical protein
MNGSVGGTAITVNMILDPYFLFYFQQEYPKLSYSYPWIEKARWIFYPCALVVSTRTSLS